ncbi:excinuclease ABC subunit UvrC [Patescibacteria group bacterium]|nr:excinuclease ABC subunit UvrC [Patescibacteria group bacterium]
MTSQIKKILSTLPKLPGVYLFKDPSGTVLYVGKAKQLKSRVSSYFQKSASLENSKKQMVTQISDIKTIVTDSEFEALLLEANLIKKYRPQYNVIFKDDKSHLFIKIEYADDYPKISTTRKITDSKSQYFGPFTDGKAVKQTLGLLRKMFPYRDCPVKIVDGKVSKGPKNRACLKYHISLCLGPCIGAVSTQEYNAIIEKCMLFLSGKSTDVMALLNKEMTEASLLKDYEKAAIRRDQIRSIKKILAEQKVVSSKNSNEDYISVYRGKELVVSLMLVRCGKLIGQENFIVNAPIDSTLPEILSSFVVSYYSKTHTFPKTIIAEDTLTFPFSYIKTLLEKRNISPKTIHKLTFFVAKRGKKKKMLALGEKNARLFLSKISHAKKDLTLTLHDLKSALALPTVPIRMECFDISNIQGTNPTASMVVFIDGHAKKSEYRRFRIKSVIGPDDTGMLYETLSRRFAKTYKEKKWPEPDLIVIDGGKGQLNAALRALKKYDVDLPIISLAKREEEIFMPGRKLPLIFSKKSEGLRLLQQLRDEAHRFAVAYHRNLRSTNSHVSILDTVPGIGPARKKQLIKHFGDIRKIEKAPLIELEKILPKKQAHALEEKIKENSYKKKK